MKPVIIFDLDETVINSKHRTPNNPDGSLNLAAYIENHTPENVFKDTLLPLAKTMQSLIASGNDVVIITARDMMAADYEFLALHGLSDCRIYSRDKCKTQKHYKLSDGLYKLKWLENLLKLKRYQNRHLIMFDDAKPVKSVLRKNGVTVLCAHKVNKRLASIQ